MYFLTLFSPGFFYCVKVQVGVFRDPPKILGTIEGSAMKLCRVMVPLKLLPECIKKFLEICHVTLQ